MFLKFTHTHKRSFYRKVLALFSVAGQDHFLFLKTHSKPGTKQFLLKKFWFLCATMPVPLKFDFIKKLLAFIDMECCRLAKIVRKKDKKRKFYSTTVTTEHSKRVNEHVMELAYNIKKEIQLEELNVTYLLYKKMIEFIQDMQQEIRNTISKVQIENNACFMELQKRKGKVVEIENKHVEIFRFPKEPEIPLRRLQEEQVEPVICLQENKFGSVPWLKQELARSAQRLQQEQEESTQRFQQEVERILQTLHQGFIEITRDVKQKNAEVSPRFPQRIARNAREEMQAEMVKLRFRSAEITRLLQRANRILTTYKISPKRT
ncbi:uncharacterized protein TNIN_270321 [Trichonephila inaurata madagascariensis]|uniref:Uncharacterized protein n=1 Tax=Trichonephila inaurata madagascariensis TaxID=2747483 RepID=A0A8X7BXW1_9ARAC|nr:uncharacterized protein TNIN_270321 [Trichonephila inaurata madagascariensis]